jgi:hypothetical protein
VAIDNIIFENNCDPEILKECDLYANLRSFPSHWLVAMWHVSHVSCVQQPLANWASGLFTMAVVTIDSEGMVPYWDCMRTGLIFHSNSFHREFVSPGSTPYQVVSDLMRDESVALFQRFYAGVNFRGICPQILLKLHWSTLAPVEKRKRRRDRVSGSANESQSSELNSNSCKWDEFVFPWHAMK